MTDRYAIVFTRSAEKAFDDLIKKNRKLGERLSKAIDRLAIDPKRGESLSGRWKGYFKYRVGDYRVVYRVVHERLVVYVITITHRREVYR